MFKIFGGGYGAIALCLCLLIGGIFSAAAPVRADESFDVSSQRAVSPPPGDQNYRIGSLDRLNITVFQVKDLTVEKMQVDASGQILLPLIGSVLARGKTTTELSREIASRLAGKYLQSPQVSVTVDEAVSQKVSVEGAVNEAGVFDLKGRTSLLEAVARAKGVARTADLHRVTIVRSVEGTPHAATFDLAAIGSGRARNPEVVGNDVVIVQQSGAKNFWRGLVEALPALYVFSFL